MTAAPSPDTPSPAAPTLAPLPPTAAAVNATRWAAVLGVLALIGLGLAWELAWAPLRPGGSWWAIKVLPLTLSVAGLLRNRMYTYRWLSLLVWLYVTEGLVRATSEAGTGAWLAVAEVVLCVWVFTACTLHVRWRLKRGAV